MPLYAGAHVRNKVALAAALTALKHKAEEAAPGLRAVLHLRRRPGLL